MRIFTNGKIEKIKEGKITAFIEVLDPQPKHTPMCMYDNDLQWFSDKAFHSTISNKPNGPEDYIKYSGYGMPGDYIHLHGITLKITDVKVMRAETMNGYQISAVLGCTYDEWWSMDREFDAIGCDEKDFVFYYEIEYVETPPLVEMLHNSICYSLEY